MEKVLDHQLSLLKIIQKIRHVFFVLFIICIPFQDFGLQATFLRFFGATLSNIPLIGLIVTLILGFILGEKTNKKSFILSGALLVYIIIYSLLVLLFTSDDNNLTFYIYKLFSNSIIFIFWLIAYIYTKNHLQNIEKYIILAYIINIIGWIICDILSINLGSMIHFGHDADYPRFHGFTLEASYFCFLTVISGILSISFTKSKFLKILFFIPIIIILFLGGSKGSLIIFFLAILLYILLNKSYTIYLKLILFLFGLLTSIAIFYYFLLNSFLIDLEESTSFASRFSSIIATFYILKDFPFGTGFGAFLIVFKDAITQSFNLLNNYIPGIVLNFAEIDNWTSSSRQEGAAIRSIIFQFIAYWGVPFLALFIYYVKVYIRILQDINGCIFYLFIFIICGLLTFASFNYESIIALAIIANKVAVLKQRSE